MCWRLDYFEGQEDAKVSRRNMQTLLTCLMALTISPAPVAQAETLGRLFFTPEQRAQLENGGARNMSRAVKMGSTPERKGRRSGAEKADSVLTVNGIVQKHGGPRTVWINGVAQNADSSRERAPESHVVTIPGKKQPVRVKVGQKLLLGKSAQSRISGLKPEKTDREED